MITVVYVFCGVVCTMLVFGLGALWMRSIEKSVMRIAAEQERREWLRGTPPEQAVAEQVAAAAEAAYRARTVPACAACGDYQDGPWGLAADGRLLCEPCLEQCEAEIVGGPGKGAA